jgi:hypothetical protein
MASFAPRVQYKKDCGSKNCCKHTGIAPDDSISDMYSSYLIKKKTVWRIRDVYPGFWIPDPDFYPSRIPDLGSRISDPGSRIPDLGSKNSNKREG